MAFDPERDSPDHDWKSELLADGEEARIDRELLIERRLAWMKVRADGANSWTWGGYLQVVVDRDNFAALEWGGRKGRNGEPEVAPVVFSSEGRPAGLADDRIDCPLFGVGVVHNTLRTERETIYNKKEKKSSFLFSLSPFRLLLSSAWHDKCHIMAHYKVRAPDPGQLPAHALCIYPT